MLLGLSCAAIAAEPADAPALDLATERLGLLAARLKVGTSGIRSISERATVETRIAGGTSAFAQQRDIVLPDRLRRAMVVEGQEQTVVISGGRGYIGSGGRALPLPPERVREALDSLDRELLVLADAVGRGGLEIVGALAAQVEGAACHDVAVSLRGVGSSLCIDERGEVLRQTVRGADPLTGAAGRIDIFYEDYRDEAGVRYPFRQRIRFDGRPIVTVNVERLSVNLAIDPGLFLVPPEP